MSLLGLGLLLGTLVETNKIRGTMKKSDIASYTENSMVTIIEKIIKKVQFIEPKVKDELTKIINANSISEIETIILKKDSILDKYGYFIFNNLFWLFNEKEILPINWMLEYIWNPLITVWQPNATGLEIKYDLFMDRYYLFAVSYTKETGLDVALLFDCNDKELMIIIKNIISHIIYLNNGLLSGETSIERFPSFQSVINSSFDSSGIEKLTQYVLDNINEIDETKYYYDKFNYVDYFNVYKKH